MSLLLRRRPWLLDEDDILMDRVLSQGPNNWARISQHLEHRSPKQCRERFHQSLKPTLSREPISRQEGEIIERLVREMGNQWAKIARHLGNRSDNAVKNWWNRKINRRKHKLSHLGLNLDGKCLQPTSMTYLQRTCHDYIAMALSSSAKSPRISETEVSRWRLSYEPTSSSTDRYRSGFLESKGPHINQGSGGSCLSSKTDCSLLKTDLVSLNSSSSTAKDRLPMARLPSPPALSHISGWHSPTQQCVDSARISPKPDNPSQATSLCQAPSLVFDEQMTYCKSTKIMLTPQADDAPLLQSPALPRAEVSLQESRPTAAFTLPNHFSSESAFSERGAPFSGTQALESEEGGFKRDIRMHVAHLAQ